MPHDLAFRPCLQAARRDRRCSARMRKKLSFGGRCVFLETVQAGWARCARVAVRVGTFGFDTLGEGSGLPGSAGQFDVAGLRGEAGSAGWVPRDHAGPGGGLPAGVRFCRFGRDGGAGARRRRHGWCRARSWRHGGTAAVRRAPLCLTGGQPDAFCRRARLAGGCAARLLHGCLSL